MEDLQVLIHHIKRAHQVAEALQVPTDSSLREELKTKDKEIMLLNHMLDEQDCEISALRKQLKQMTGCGTDNDKDT